MITATGGVCAHGFVAVMLSMLSPIARISVLFFPRLVLGAAVCALGQARQAPGAAHGTTSSWAAFLWPWALPPWHTTPIMFREVRR